MSALYHINPYTGVPGICHAKRGNCPYGGKSGVENHFSTYEQAQFVADKIQAEQFQDYKEIEKYDKKRDWSASSKYNYLNDLSDEEALNTINETTDFSLLQAVVDGQVLTRPDNDPKFIKAALRNDYLDDDLLEDISDNPEQYSKEAILAFEDNPMLTSAGRVDLIRADLSDYSFCRKILSHKKITSEAIIEALSDFRGENNENYPTQIAGLLFNPNCPKAVYEEWLNDPSLSHYMYNGR